jgi:hypothetical protein
MPFTLYNTRTIDHLVDRHRSQFGDNYRVFDSRNFLLPLLEYSSLCPKLRRPSITFVLPTTVILNIGSVVHHYKYCVSRHPSSCFYLKHNVSENVFCLRIQVESTQLGPIDTASPYLRTPAGTRDRIYKPSTAQTICES